MCCSLSFLWCVAYAFVSTQGPSTTVDRRSARVVFRSAALRDSSIDFMAECDAWLNTTSAFKRAYTRLCAVAHNDSGAVVCEKLGVSPFDLVAYSRATDTYDAFTVVQTKRAMLLGLVPVVG